MPNKYWLIGGILVLLLAINLIDWGGMVGLLGRGTLETPYMKAENLGYYVNLYLRSIVAVFLLALLAGLSLYWSHIKIHLKLPRIPALYWLAGLVLLYVIVFWLMSFLRYYSFHSYHDMTANLEAIWNVMKSGVPNSTAEGSLYELPVMNWFGIHFTPIIYLFALFALPFRFPQGVFFWQTVFLASGAMAVYLIAQDLLKSKSAALAWAAIYLLYPTLQYTNLYEVEFFRLATPLLLWAFYFIQKKTPGIAFLLLLLTLFTREDAAPVVLILGAYLLFSGKTRGLGIITAATALIYGFAAQILFRPLFSQGTDFVIKNVFNAYGQTPLQVLIYFMTHPGVGLALMLSPLKIMNVVLLLLPLGFLSLLSPGLFVVALAGMSIPLLSPGIGQATIFLHKYAAAIPFIFISGIYGFNNMAKRWGGKAAFLPLTMYLLAAGLLSCVLFGPAPISRQFWDPNYRLADFRTHNFNSEVYRINAHHILVHEVIDMIPVNTVVSAEHFLLPHLFDRKKLYTFPIVGNDVEYILIDRNNPKKNPEFNPGSKSSAAAELFKTDPARVYRVIERDRGFIKIFDQDGIGLFRKAR